MQGIKGPEKFRLNLKTTKNSMKVIRKIKLRSNLNISRWYQET
jgi:hypothetical protein